MTAHRQIGAENPSHRLVAGKQSSFPGRHFHYSHFLIERKVAGLQSIFPIKTVEMQYFRGIQLMCGCNAKTVQFPAILLSLHSAEFEECAVSQEGERSGEGEIAINGAAAARRPNFVSLTVQRVSSGRDSHSLIVGCGAAAAAPLDGEASEAADSCRRKASFRMYMCELPRQIKNKASRFTIAAVLPMPIPHISCSVKSDVTLIIRAAGKAHIFC